LRFQTGSLISDKFLAQKEIILLQWAGLQNRGVATAKFSPKLKTLSPAASAHFAWEHSLKEQGIAIELRRTWKYGGEALYFRDPDGHLLEVVTPGIWNIY